MAVVEEYMWRDCTTKRPTMGITLDEPDPVLILEVAARRQAWVERLRVWLPGKPGMFPHEPILSSGICDVCRRPVSKSITCVFSIRFARRGDFDLCVECAEQLANYDPTRYPE